MLTSGNMGNDKSYTMQISENLNAIALKKEKMLRRNQFYKII